MPNPTPDTPRRRKPDTYGRLVKGAASRRPALPGSSGGSGWGWSRAVLPGSDYDYQARAGDLGYNGAVAACLRILCDNAGQPRIQVESEGDDGKLTTVVGHDLPKLFHRPNEHMGRYELSDFTYGSAALDGNSYTLKVRSEARIVRELWPLMPGYITPVSLGGSSWIDYYEYTAQGASVLLPPSEVIHFKWGRPDPATAGRTYISYVKSGLRAICGLNEADGFIASILRNMGVPGVVISPSAPEGKFTRDQGMAIAEDWRHRYTGENRGRPFVASGPITVTPIQMTPDDMALPVISGRQEQQICSLMGPSAMVAGLPGGNDMKTYANAEAASKGLYDELIVPLQARYADTLDRQLLGDPGMGEPDREHVSFNYEAIACLQEDQQPIWDRSIAAYEKGVAKRSESREMVGLPFDEADEIYVSDVAVATAKATMPPTDPAAIDSGDKPTEDVGAVEDYAYDDPADAPAKAPATRADDLARSAPEPVDADEAAVVAKAMATLDAIRSQLRVADGPDPTICLEHGALCDGNHDRDEAA